MICRSCSSETAIGRGMDIGANPLHAARKAAMMMRS
jgi:hypothetical protein